MFAGGERGIFFEDFSTPCSYQSSVTVLNSLSRRAIIYQLWTLLLSYPPPTCPLSTINYRLWTFLRSHSSPACPPWRVYPPREAFPVSTNNYQLSTFLRPHPPLPQKELFSTSPSTL